MKCRQDHSLPQIYLSKRNPKFVQISIHPPRTICDRFQNVHLNCLANKLTHQGKGRSVFYEYLPHSLYFAFQAVLQFW